MSERLKPQVKTIVTLTPRHGEDHPSSPALSRRPPLVIIHPDAQHHPTGRSPDDGMDSVRRSLRWLSTTHLPETRLIVCSMDGEQMFPDLMTMLSEPEFLPLHRRVLVTADPAYLARWTTSPHVVTYQRRFLSAVRSAPDALSAGTSSSRS